MKHSDPLNQVIASWRANSRATIGEHLVRQDFSILLADGIPSSRIIEGIQLHCSEQSDIAPGSVATKIRNRWKMNVKEEKAIQASLERDEQEERWELRRRLDLAALEWGDTWHGFMLNIAKHYDAAFVSWFCAYEECMRENHTTRCLKLVQYDSSLRDFEAKEGLVVRPNITLCTQAEWARYMAWRRGQKKSAAVEVEAAPVESECPF